MIEWLSSNIPNILIVAAVISACAAVIVHEIKMKRKAEKSGGSFCPAVGQLSGCNVHHRVEREENDAAAVTVIILAVIVSALIKSYILENDI